jgi:hypothetical protein
MFFAGGGYGLYDQLKIFIQKFNIVAVNMASDRI